MSPTSTSFRPALIIVDVQEDFCPPNGALPVPEGRAIIPTINTLLSYPFALKIATKDWHPPSHISFAANHKDAVPYQSTTKITNPRNSSETYESLLWPVHCVQNTPGAELLPELHTDKLDLVIEKGQMADVEMYSAFYTPLKNPRIGDSGLADRLREKGITHVYCVGLAADYCVMSTAVDAAAEGFETVIVEEGTRAAVVDGWSECKRGITGKGVKVVSEDGEEVERVKTMK